MLHDIGNWTWTVEQITISVVLVLVLTCIGVFWDKLADIASYKYAPLLSYFVSLIAFVYIGESGAIVLLLGTCVATCFTLMHFNEAFKKNNSLLKANYEILCQLLSIKIKEHPDEEYGKELLNMAKNRLREEND